MTSSFGSGRGPVMGPPPAGSAHGGSARGGGGGALFTSRYTDYRISKPEFHNHTTLGLKDGRCSLGPSR